VLDVQADLPQLEAFERWLRGVSELGLTPEIAPTSYSKTPEKPGPREYRNELERLMQFADAITHVAYVEPWNEPNAQGGFTLTTEAIRPAQYADAAHSVCEDDGCTVIAGNFEDDATVAGYLREYKRGLSWTPLYWGVHPYHAVMSTSTGAHNAGNLEQFERELATEHYSNAELWYTEVGAYYCIAGEVRTRQANDAAQLVNTLIPAKRPAHVFYYGFMYKNHETAPCNNEPGHNDTELYTATGEARPAASMVYGPGGPPSSPGSAAVRDVVTARQQVDSLAQSGQPFYWYLTGSDWSG
jgi:hypothetical protein